MKEEKIKELLKSLFDLQYNWSSSGSSYKSAVINKEGRHNVENIIRKFILEGHDSKVGELEAKCFAYEQMIAKSTFAPMLPSEPKQEDITVKEALAEIVLQIAGIHNGHGFIIDTIKSVNTLTPPED